MKIISIINLKGGVAKTLTADNMAHVLAVFHNKRVLLVDNDKQGNTSKAFGVHSYDEKSLSDVLTARGWTCGRSSKRPGSRISTYCPLT